MADLGVYVSKSVSYAVLQMGPVVRLNKTASYAILVPLTSLEVSRCYTEIVASTILRQVDPLVPTVATALSPYGIPRTRGGFNGKGSNPGGVFPAKPSGGLPPLGFTIPDFDIWRPGYSAAKVQITMAGSVQPAPIFYDVLLTQPAPNPQILDTQVDSNKVTYGRWRRPIYTYVPYYLLINDTDTTGVVYPPVLSLDGEDGSFMLVNNGAPGAPPVTMRAFLQRRIDVANYGPWTPNAGAQSNGVTLAAAIGAAGSMGGGTVVIPGGTFPVTPFTLPQGVILEGQGLAATVIQCISGAPAMTMGGDGCGFRNLTFDGVVVAQNSIGISATGKNALVLDNVLVQRFQFGILARGLENCTWTNFSISGCTGAATLSGDSATGLGNGVSNILWIGGNVSLNLRSGFVVQVIDVGCNNIKLIGVSFTHNQGAAVDWLGVHDSTLDNCSWDSNAVNWNINDGANTMLATIATTRNVVIKSGTVNGGAVNGAQCIFGGTCTNVRVQDATIFNCNIELLVPLNFIVFQDCFLDPSTVVTGTTKQFVTLRTADTGIVTGVTLDNAALVAWQLQLKPGEVCFVTAQAVAKQINGANFGIFWEACGAEQPGATLAYSSGTSAFSVGTFLTGAVSKATAIIQAKSGSTASGTLTLIQVTGSFLVGEVITDSAGGVATATGAFTPANTVLDATGQTHVRTPTVTGSSGYAVGIVVSSQMVQVTVTGATGHVVDWDVKVSVVIG